MKGNTLESVNQFLCPDVSKGRGQYKEKVNKFMNKKYFKYLFFASLLFVAVYLLTTATAPVLLPLDLLPYSARKSLLEKTCEWQKFTQSWAEWTKYMESLKVIDRDIYKSNLNRCLNDAMELECLIKQGIISTNEYQAIKEHIDVFFKNAYNTQVAFGRDSKAATIYTAREKEKSYHNINKQLYLLDELALQDACISWVFYNYIDYVGSNIGDIYSITLADLKYWNPPADISAVNDLYGKSKKSYDMICHKYIAHPDNFERIELSNKNQKTALNEIQFKTIINELSSLRSKLFVAKPNLTEKPNCEIVLYDFNGKKMYFTVYSNGAILFSEKTYNYYTFSIGKHVLEWLH